MHTGGDVCHGMCVTVSRVSGYVSRYPMCVCHCIPCVCVSRYPVCVCHGIPCVCHGIPCVCVTVSRVSRYVCHGEMCVTVSRTAGMPALICHVWYALPSKGALGCAPRAHARQGRTCGTNVPPLAPSLAPSLPRSLAPSLPRSVHTPSHAKRARVAVHPRAPLSRSQKALRKPAVLCLRVSVPYVRTPLRAESKARARALAESTARTPRRRRPPSSGSARPRRPRQHRLLRCALVNSGWLTIVGWISPVVGSAARMRWTWEVMPA
jgi:hypothetical protein